MNGLTVVILLVLFFCLVVLPGAFGKRAFWRSRPMPRVEPLDAKTEQTATAPGDAWKNEDNRFKGE